MFVYFILFVILVGFAIEENKKNQNKLEFIAFLLIFSLFSFRSYAVGSDTPVYIREYLSQTSNMRDIDFGFAKYNELLYNLGLSARQYLIVTSFLICFPVFFFIRKLSEKKILTYFLYITIGNFSFDLSGIRQSLAVGVVLLGYLCSLYVTSKWKKYMVIAVFIILASQFHASAKFCLIFVPILWVSQKNFKTNKILLAILILTPLVLPFTSIFAFLTEKINIFRYENYEADSSRINIIAYFIIPYVIFLYLTILKHCDKQSSFSPNDNFAYLCAFMYVLSASASFYIPIFSRMEFYFSLPMLSLIPTLTSRVSASKRKPLITAIVVVCVLFFVIAQSGGIMRIDNYSFSVN